MMPSPTGVNCSHIASAMGAALLLACAGAASASDPSPFATVVHDFSPAPGQFANNPAFNDPARAIGPPSGGGTLTPDLSSLVSLGGFGGSITLGFAYPIPNLLPSPTNPRGLDLIVFGNAVYAAGNATRRFAEAATVEVAVDTNNNGVPDDPWYLIPGSHLPHPPSGIYPLTRTLKTWDADTSDPTFPPDDPSWLPPGSPTPPTTFTTSAFRLPALFEVGLLIHPEGPTATQEVTFGYADCTPTLRLGDLNADNVIDDPTIPPHAFYTVPDDPFIVGITPHSGGGDAIDLTWAVDPATGQPANLTHIHFVRITTAVDFLAGPLGELSSEIDAVARVIPPRVSDFNRDRIVDLADLIAFLEAWLPALGGPSPGPPYAFPTIDLESDGVIDLADLIHFLQHWLVDLGG